MIHMYGKKWWRSKACWASVVTFLVGTYTLLRPVLEGFGVNAPPLSEEVLSTLMGWGVLGFYGRVSAKEKVALP